MATTRSSTKRAAPDLTGDNFDAGAIRHSDYIPKATGDGSKYTSVESDNHEDPETGTHQLTYPARGNG